MKAIIINLNYCKKCHICVDFCPKSVFTLNENGYPVVERPEQCIGCKLCIMRCPDFAINMEG